MADTAKINGRKYDWSSIDVEIQGSTIPLLGCSSIKYSTERKIENQYGLGSHPIGRGFGNVTCDASITLDYNTIRALQEAAYALGDAGAMGEERDHENLGSLIELGSFNLTVSFAMAGEATKTVVLHECVFTEDGFDANQEDTVFKKELKLNPIKIQHVPSV